MLSQKLMWNHLQKLLKQPHKVPFLHRLNLNLVGIFLEVTGSRDGDKTEDAYRQKAYEQIVNSQLQEATKDWVKALRKNADIQYFDK